MLIRLHYLLQVPARVQWEGLRDRGADYFPCVPETAVNPLMFVFSSGRITAGLTLRIQTVITRIIACLELEQEFGFRSRDAAIFVTGRREERD